ncbi:alpha/beta hydrolase-fold protein [Agarivorans aestuarii]|uniref:Alpha/beta hydrolase-fold protein n=1 Tax=Agarivorans aestuarii TaxID=1563703 RepID=A0ABU7G6R6_9ALTE|nr:alpha/beta hydrolase-fold protein [Agarivorans aestuarii]MEE1674912.1 alpha/beta hydrolase-fold protein [Agarivorans aestuarii]
MNREYHRWWSPNLHRDMELLVFGHAGAKVLVFPTRGGRFYEYENLGLVNSIAHKINAGQLQLYCVDSIDIESMYCFWAHPAGRIQRHQQYEEYILREVLPLMAQKNDHPCTISHGCSLGAFHAANIVFRHPHLFNKLAAFSGRFDLTWQVESFSDLFEGFYDDSVYFHTPTHYLVNLTCPQRLAALADTDLLFIIGNQDPFLQNNHALSHILNQKGLNHRMIEWQGRAHRGRYWRQMVPLHL